MRTSPVVRQLHWWHNCRCCDHRRQTF